MLMASTCRKRLLADIPTTPARGSPDRPGRVSGSIALTAWVTDTCFRRVAALSYEESARCRRRRGDADTPSPSCWRALVPPA